MRLEKESFCHPTGGESGEGSRAIRSKAYGEPGQGISAVKGSLSGLGLPDLTPLMNETPLWGL